MVLAYHLIMSAYGFWLPNDERGSWSDFIRAYELYLAGGPATKVNTRRSVADDAYDSDRRQSMRETLARDPVRFNPSQIDAIAAGFADYCRRTNCRVHACAILPDHAHLVVARHRVLIERVCEQFKGAATTELNRRGLHPFADQPYRNGKIPTPWVRRGWWVFLNSPEGIGRAIQYVEDNPVKAGLQTQNWEFVKPFLV